MDSNKALVHGCVESPRFELIYRGKTKLRDGKALVKIDIDSCPSNPMMEGTFDALTSDASVFLQNIDSFDRLRGKVVNNILEIISENNKSNDGVAWLIIAERNDSTLLINTHTDDKGKLRTERERHEVMMKDEDRPSRNKKQK